MRQDRSRNSLYVQGTDKTKAARNTTIQYQAYEIATASKTEDGID